MAEQVFSAHLPLHWQTFGDTDRLRKVEDRLILIEDTLARIEVILSRYEPKH